MSARCTAAACDAETNFIKSLTVINSDGRFPYSKSKRFFPRIEKIEI